MTLTKGLYAGSFDPLTKGHLDIIERAADLANTLYVGLFVNPQKQGLFTMEERFQILQESLRHLPNVKIILAEDRLLAEVAQELEVAVLFRGLRNPEDFSYEANMDYFNRQLTDGLETLYLMAQPALAPINSSRIRELIHFKRDISDYVPTPVLGMVLKKYENE
ncbi:pantetheine-phosphate adenylyltransferase [Streptococcus danieliae]|uniref:Phosphopantetheine adenylyltransferase n=1 Tax=Streptococcus danieliae TaxID=747656 RepID=A0A7X3G7H0_9STRE|nr:pantetheine-phosphate adenylyltransferase [Streptococcus danieliae]MVX58548.1 pantetheine-phosphate adenylyltransferase [Streptococcus danieliae]